MDPRHNVRAASPSGGFTLLEMVIAIAIFAIVGAISYTTLDNFLSTRERLEAHNETSRRLQRTIGYFERDVRFMALRPVRDGLGEVVPALYTPGSRDGNGILMELTVAMPSWQHRQWHHLERIGWVMEDGVLRRQVWPVLDRDFDSAPRETTLLEGVNRAELRFYEPQEDGRGVEPVEIWERPERLPVAVELILVLDGGTTYRRLVEVNGVPS